MPVYVYRYTAGPNEGETVEVLHGINEPALTVCPTTGEPVERAVARPSAPILHGSGFYQNDYASKRP